MQARSHTVAHVKQSGDIFPSGTPLEINATCRAGPCTQTIFLYEHATAAEPDLTFEGVTMTLIPALNSAATAPGPAAAESSYKLCFDPVCPGPV
eukprot:SAG11_NODE_3806_length_2214_cov_1.889362_2_plen_93_part_01